MHVLDSIEEDALGLVTSKDLYPPFSTTNTRRTPRLAFVDAMTGGADQVVTFSGGETDEQEMVVMAAPKKEFIGSVEAGKMEAVPS